MSKKIQENQLNRIIKYYTLTTVLLVILLPLSVSAAIYGQRQSARLSDMAQVARAMVSELNDRATEVNRLAYSLTATSEWENELYRYFDMTYSQHWTQYLISEDKREFLPKEIHDAYQYDDELQAIQIVLEGRELAYESSQTSKYGNKVEKWTDFEGIHFTRSLRSISTNDTIGQIQIIFSFEEMKRKIFNDSSQGILMIYDPLSQRLVGSEEVNLAQQGLDEVALNHLYDHWRKDYLMVVESVHTGHQVIFLDAKKNVLLNLIPITLLIIFVCVLMAGSILFIILRQLRHYAIQVNDILDATGRIEQGQLYYRISQASKEGELLQITQAINAMLDGQQSVMKQVYQLQAKHSEAVLKALQAQINPHFLYNTLEFIRMSAYVEGSESLAEFVYDFSSLLRNTITDEKEATIQSEIEFIKKYVHLYQARYPEKLQLKIEVTSSLSNFTLPKFTFQPLVENYLVHGIDFTREDNVIEIRVEDLEEEISIKIEDNGQGISESKISEINERLGMILAAPFEWEETHTSLGVNLVAQRLGQKFGKNIQMYYENRVQGGVTIWINIKKEI